MATIYDGNWQTAVFGSTTMAVISTQWPEGVLDDPTPTTTASSGAAHGQVAGQRVKYGNLKITVAYDTAVMALAMGTTTGAPNVNTLTLTAKIGASTVTIAFTNMALAKRTPSELAMGNNQPSLELEFQFNAASGVSYPSPT